MDQELMSMDQEKKTPEIPRIKMLVDNAVNAVSEIIVETLRGSRQSKFADAARLCSVGQSLLRAQASQVDDFAVMDGGADDVNVADRPLVVPQRRGAVFGGRTADDREVQRDFMLTFGNNAQIHAEAQKATVATQEANELQSLMALRNTIPEAQRGVIDGRIATLLMHMESRNAPDLAEAEPEPGVADPLLPRGHQVGEGGAREDAPPGLPAHGGGGEGNGVVAFACRVPEAAAGEALGEGL